MTTIRYGFIDYEDFVMNEKLMFTLAIALIICLLATAGCTSTPGTVQPATCQVTPAVQPHAAVSFNAAPVKYAQVNGVSLGYREFGSGEPLLMVEGFGATIDMWNQTFIGILATKYHVYTYDHRGMGYSGDNNATPTIAQYADDAAGLMTALGYDSMHVYGVSLGSSISQQLVIDHPERVRKLVLDSSVYSIRIPETENCSGVLKQRESIPNRPKVSTGKHRQISRGMGPGTAFRESRKMSCSFLVPQTTSHPMRSRSIWQGRSMDHGSCGLRDFRMPDPVMLP